MKAHHETKIILALGVAVFFVLAAFSDRGFGSEEDDKSFCSTVAEISSKLAWESEEARRNTYAGLERWMPVMASHVVPATKAAMRARMHGYTQEYIRVGIYNHCKVMLEDV